MMSVMLCGSVAMLLLLGGCDALFRIAAVPDADVDAPTDTNALPPTFTIASSMRAAATPTIDFALAVPPGPNRFLVVSVEIAVDGSVPTSVSSIVAAGHAMTMIDAVTGVPGGPMSRSEQWMLVAPEVGSDDISILLDSTPLTIHANAMAFAGVNQTTPVRASNHGPGQSLTGSVVVSSTSADLVESTVGCGTAITGPALGATSEFTDNNSGANSLDNAAGSTAPGVNTAATMGWAFAASDDWQIIAASLEPAQ